MRLRPSGSSSIDIVRGRDSARPPSPKGTGAVVSLEGRARGGRSNYHLDTPVAADIIAIDQSWGLFGSA